MLRAPIAAHHDRACAGQDAHRRPGMLISVLRYVFEQRGGEAERRPPSTAAPRYHLPHARLPCLPVILAHQHHIPAIPRRAAAALRQYLLFCTSKASKLTTCCCCALPPAPLPLLPLPPTPPTGPATPRPTTGLNSGTACVRALLP